MAVTGSIGRERNGGTITWLEVVALVAIGIALRVWWMTLVHAWSDPVDLGEATNEAMTFARAGVLGDPYFPSQGPSAHLLPTMPLIAGTIERLLGPDSAAASITLALWALAQVAAGFVLTTMLFRRLGASRAALLAGLAVLCLLPANIASEGADFRVWEGALAYDLAAANLLWMVVLCQQREIATRDLAVAAVLAAAAFFVDPPAGLAAVVAWTLVTFARLSIRQALLLALLAAAALAVPVVPWTLRNQATLGHPIPLRSNFGLELAIANYDGALDPDAPRSVSDARIAAVHQNEQRWRRAGGEVAYSRQVGAAAEQWIVAHPLGFARLSLRHYRQFYIPDTWAEDATNWSGAKRLRIRIIQFVGLFGLIGLGVGLWQRHAGYRLIGSYVAVAGLPYALVQPIPRYGYIVYPLLVFLAARLVVEGFQALRRSSPPGARWPR